MILRPEDFVSVTPKYRSDLREECARIANARLEEMLREAPKLYGTPIPTGEKIQWRNYSREGDVVTARLFCIEEVVKP